VPLLLKAMSESEDKTVAAVQVRTARFEDVEKLASMRLALQQHMRASNPRLLTMSHQAIINLDKQYCLHMENPMRRVVVAEDCNGTLIGMAMGTIADRDDLEPPRCGRIDDVWVEPDWRRQGLAKQLLDKVLAFFENNAVSTLVLDYSIGNIDAECTWKALGFEPILTVAVATPYELRRRLQRTDA
jgi:GNAT superfamily N-acetyltransferase